VRQSYSAENIKSLDRGDELEKSLDPADDENKIFEADPSPSDAKDGAVAGVTSPALHAGTTTTTADRGVAVAPDVVGGTTTLGAYFPGETEGLVVAIAVTEDDEDDDVLRVFGTEYDPDAKPPLYKNRRVRLCAIVACVMLIAIVGGTLGAVLGNSSKSVIKSVPTLAPLPAKDVQYYRIFAGAVGNDLVYQPGTPHQMAADWIIYTDPMQLSPQSDHIVQRYLLTLFYYQMSQNGKSPWRSCNPPTGSQNDTCVFLDRVDTVEILKNGTEFDNITFYPETINPESGNGYYRWLSGAHECLWAGNLCDTNNLLRSIELCTSLHYQMLPNANLQEFWYLTTFALILIVFLFFQLLKT
jgi:hypothetical protein